MLTWESSYHPVRRRKFLADAHLAGLPLCRAVWHLQVHGLWLQAAGNARLWHRWLVNMDPHPVNIFKEPLTGS